MAKTNSINTDLDIHITDANYPKDIASRLKEILNDQIFGSTGDVVEYVDFSCDPSEVPIIGSFTIHLNLGKPIDMSEYTCRRSYLRGAVDGILAALDFPFSTVVEEIPPVPAEAPIEAPPEAAVSYRGFDFDAGSVPHPVSVPSLGYAPPEPAPRPTTRYEWVPITMSNTAGGIG